jgi:hypothetical protein
MMGLLLLCLSGRISILVLRQSAIDNRELSTPPLFDFILKGFYCFVHLGLLLLKLNHLLHFLVVVEVGHYGALVIVGHHEVLPELSPHEFLVPIAIVDLDEQEYEEEVH